MFSPPVGWALLPSHAALDKFQTNPRSCAGRVLHSAAMARQATGRAAIATLFCWTCASPAWAQAPDGGALFEPGVDEPENDESGRDFAPRIFAFVERGQFFEVSEVPNHSRKGMHPPTATDDGR